MAAHAAVGQPSVPPSRHSLHGRRRQVRADRPATSQQRRRRGFRLRHCLQRVGRSQADAFWASECEAIRSQGPSASSSIVGNPRGFGGHELISPSDSGPYGLIIRILYESQGIDWRKKIHIIDSFPVVKSMVASSNAIGGRCRDLCGIAEVQGAVRITRLLSTVSTAVNVLRHALALGAYAGSKGLHQGGERTHFLDRSLRANGRRWPGAMQRSYSSISTHFCPSNRCSCSALNALRSSGVVFRTILGR